jgi:Ca2+-binding RTX toxin-like protein
MSQTALPPTPSPALSSAPAPARTAPAAPAFAALGQPLETTAPAALRGPWLADQRAAPPATARQRSREEQAATEAEAEALQLAQASTLNPSLANPGASSVSAAAGAESCPVSEPGTADACGVAGAADAHPAGGPVWLLGLLPLGLAGGGGGGGAAKDPGPTNIFPGPLVPAAPGTVPGPTNINAPLNVRHPIDTLGDNGQKLADFDSNQPNAVFSVVRVTDAATGATVDGRAAEGAGPYNPSNYPGTNPATDPWFYLNKTTGEVFLTAAGAAAQCIGQGHTITAQAVANGITSAQGQMTFTLAPPLAQTIIDHGGTTRDAISKAAGNTHDVLAINSPITAFHVFMNGNRLHIQTEPSAPGSTTTVSEIANHLSTNALEYVSFNNLSYYGYSLGDKAAFTNYFEVATDLNPSRLPDSSSLTGNGLVGSSCSDLLFNDSTFSMENFFGGAGNDLIFVGADDGRSISPLVRSADGGAGNDLLVGSSGADRLIGGSGNDVLIGGSGKDTLTGGAGNDVFVFNRSPGAAHADTITDFTVGQDKIMLDGRVFVNLSSLTYNASNGQLSYADQLFATLADRPSTFSLDSSNFLIV